MAEPYNPIVRAFCQLRAALCATLDLPRNRVTVHTLLKDLIPLEQRRSAWWALRASGLQMPGLGLSPTALLISASLVIVALAGLMLWTGEWWPSAVAFIPAWIVAFRASRPWAVHLPPFVRTVGELAVYGTRFGDHESSGYRWAHGDISLKVRMVLAESLGLPLEQVRPESTFRDLGVS